MTSSPSPHSFKGKVVLLTGGTSPLDVDLAIKLADLGAHVHVIGPTGNFLDSLTRGEITTYPADLSSRPDFVKVVDSINAHHGHIDLLINAASASILGLVKDLSQEDWEEVLDLNVRGTINSIELVYPAMVERGQGHVVNLGSIASDTLEPGSVPFATSKAFVLGLDRSLQSEAKLAGIDLTLVLLGHLSPAHSQKTRTVNASQDKTEAAHTLSKASPGQIADAIIAGISRKKRRIYFPSFQAKLLWFVAHWFPSLSAPVQKRFLKPFRDSDSPS